MSPTPPSELQSLDNARDLVPGMKFSAGGGAWLLALGCHACRAAGKQVPCQGTEINLRKVFMKAQLSHPSFWKLMLLSKEREIQKHQSHGQGEGKSEKGWKKKPTFSPPFSGTAPLMTVWPALERLSFTLNMRLNFHVKT